jgi:hypothetical protein
MPNENSPFIKSGDPRSSLGVIAPIVSRSSSLLPSESDSPDVLFGSLKSSFLGSFSVHDSCSDNFGSFSLEASWILFLLRTPNLSNLFGVSSSRFDSVCCESNFISLSNLSEESGELRSDK